MIEIIRCRYATLERRRFTHRAQLGFYQVVHLVPVPKYTRTVLISQLVFPIWIRMASVLIRIQMGVKMCAENVDNCSKPNNFNRSWTFL